MILDLLSPQGYKSKITLDNRRHDTAVARPAHEEHDRFGWVTVWR
jgi:hypothetical protein